MKHAYLILAHEYNYNLESLIASIDDERNDIYIHIDKKSIGFPFEKIRELVKKSQICFVDRINTNWASYRLVEAELILLETALANGNYMYYHLLSGADMPLRNQNDIHHFFEVNNGYQFVEIEQSQKDNDRVQFYYVFQNFLKRGDKSIFFRICYNLQKNFLAIQKKLNLRRNKDLHFFRGAQWFSITESCAKYVVRKKVEINRVFNHTFCPDEFFIQTIIANSEFKHQVYKKYDNKIENSLRFIDWNRGNPYVFCNDDFEVLINSKMMFARKFSEKVDRQIIENIRNYCKIK